VKMPYRAIAWGLVAPRGGMASVCEIKQALVEHGPLESCVFDTKTFVAYRGGIYREASKLPAAPAANHLVVIVGWDDRRGTAGCWKIQSSWGKRWGEGGFMWLEYGSNSIGDSACWVRAQSKQYRLPDDVHKEIDDAAEPFPIWRGAKIVSPTRAEDPLLAPAEALKHEGERIAIEFSVEGGSITPAGDVELFTKKSWRDEGCILTRLLKSDLHKFGAADNRTLLESYQGKRIRVRGSLQPNPLFVGKQYLGDRPFIEVANPKQIEIVK
jgi:hypothetical protein